MRALLPLILLAALWVCPPPALAQQPAPPPYWLRVEAGYHDAELGHAAAFHQAIADYYAAAGIRLPTQQLYPGSLILGAEVATSLASGPGWEGTIGLGARYTEARAYSLYGDYAGTLDVVSRAQALTVEGVSQVVFRPDARIKPVLGTRGGVLLGRVSTRDDMELGDLGSASSEVVGRGTGFTVEGFGGAHLPLGRVTITAQLGYRYARTGYLSARLFQDGQSVGSGTFEDYRLNFSGIVATSGVSIRLR